MKERKPQDLLDPVGGRREEGILGQYRAKISKKEKKENWGEAKISRKGRRKIGPKQISANCDAFRHGHRQHDLPGA